jgi:hypothetical protein
MLTCWALSSLYFGGFLSSTSTLTVNEQMGVRLFPAASVAEYLML